jgi:arylsulfatase
MNQWRRLLIAVGAVAVLFGIAQLIALVPTAKRAPNLLLIVVDTLRADHVSAYGYARPTTPTLDALAAESVVFRDAMSPAPVTIPSMVQIMTGKLRGSGNAQTLAERLRDHGYQTLAIVDNPLIELRDSLLGRGFDEIFMNDVVDERTVQQHYKTKTPADVITRRAIRWLDARDGRTPFFAWLHYFDPHDPYAPPHPQASPFLTRTASTSSSPAASKWTGDIRRNPISNPKTADRVVVTAADRQRIIDLYDSEIHYVDQSLADLFAHLRARGLYDDTVIAVTSDHGEAFGEHGEWMHGRSLYQNQVHVPLLIKPAGRRKNAREVNHPVQLLDLTPTLCKSLEIVCENFTRGRDLLEDQSSETFAVWNSWIAMREGSWKLVFNVKNGQARLYDLAADPLEQTDLAEAEPETFARLLARKDALLSEVIPPGLLEFSAKEALQLRALGYLE